MQKLLMTGDAVGGVWTYALELARALAPHGITVALATMGPEPSLSQRRAANALENLELFESSWKLEWMDDPWHDVRAAGDWLLELEQRAQPDVIHLNGYCHAALPFAAPVVVAAHSCVCSWWRAVRGGDAPGEWTRYREEVRRGLSAAREVVAPSHAMLRALEENYGPPARARVIPNGREAGRSTALPKQPFVFSSGRMWDEAKNAAAVEHAAARIEWPVYIAGEDGRRDGEGKATRLGKLSPAAMDWWFSRASIYALPARYEPFGLSVLEAALRGCALALGDIDSLRENWDGAAEFVDPADPGALAAAVNGLIADPARRIRLANLARERALSFTPGRMADAYVSLYRGLAV